MTARLTLRLGLFAIVAFVVGLVAARWLLAPGWPGLPHEPPVPVTESAMVFETPRAIPSLALVDQDGQPFTAQSLRGRWSVVFFGFTHCADVCPTTLAVLKQLHTQLADLPESQRPHVLFFTVDPERDTPERVREYVRFFDPTFGAATGTAAGVQQAADTFAVPYAKVPLPGGGYTMDHGAGLFFVGPDGSNVAYASPPLQADALSRDYRKLLGYYEAVHE